MVDMIEFHEARIADVTIGDLMSQIAIFCYCGGELGKVIPDSTEACRPVRRCNQCDAVYELDVKINKPSAGELMILLRERENAGATTS